MMEILRKEMAPTSHHNILNRLGEDAGWFLQTYCLVQHVVQCELHNSFEYASDTSPLGEVDRCPSKLT